MFAQISLQYDKNHLFINQIMNAPDRKNCTDLFLIVEICNSTSMDNFVLSDKLTKLLDNDKELLT